MIKHKINRLYQIMFIIVILLLLLVSIKGINQQSDNSIDDANTPILSQQRDEDRGPYYSQVEETEIKESPTPSGNGDIKGIDLITEVTPYGERVIAAAIEYDAIIDGESLNTSSYSVIGTSLYGSRDTRTISRVYTNNSVALTNDIKNGEYVIIELDQNDDNAGTFEYSFDTGLNTRPAPDYLITQINNIYLENRKIIQPSGNEINSTGEINLIVDDFEKLSYSNNDLKLDYRFFKPNTIPQDKYPLVVFLHGSGERGNGNDVQILASKGAVVWASPESQETNPAFILSPQAPAGNNWTTESVNEAVLNLIDEIIGTYPIDIDRVYITGLSLGGSGVWGLIQDNPDTFAAAISICGWGNPDNVEDIKQMPIWVFHSEDDSTIPVLRSREMVNALRAAGSKVLYTEYPSGTVIPDHFSWVPAYENKDVIEWLFDQQR